jgi:hypothetical protein
MSDEKVAQLLSDLLLTNPDMYDLVQAIRTLVYTVVPNASERVMYGGFMFEWQVQFCGVFAYSKHVGIEFGRGCDLKDPHRVLEGKGKLRRHIKIIEFSDIEEKHLLDYIARAHKLSCSK